MDIWLLGSLVLIGITVSVSPCPLATNIAAIGFLSQNLDSRKASLLASLLYTLGRILAYVAIGLLINSSLTAMPSLSYWLQEELPVYLGPVTMLVGLVILDYIPLPSFGKTPGADTAKNIMRRFGGAGALILGFLFAVALCPSAAALFFGTAIPLSLEAGASHAWIGISMFGLGTALPVILFSLLFLFSMEKAAKIMRNMPKIQQILKLVTGWFFIGLGGYWLFTNILFN